MQPPTTHGDLLNRIKELRLREQLTARIHNIIRKSQEVWIPWDWLYPTCEVTFFIMEPQRAGPLWVFCQPCIPAMPY